MTIHAVQAISDLSWHQTRRLGDVKSRFVVLVFVYVNAFMWVLVTLWVGFLSIWLTAEVWVKVAGYQQGDQGQFLLTVP